MTLVLDVLNDKGGIVHAIAAQATVYDAISRMARLSIGSLVVMDESKLVGMLTERDYLRQIILKGRTSRTTLVHEIMSCPIATVSPGDDIDHCLATMTERRFRHLPVILGQDVVGIVSIGDLVRRKIIDQGTEIRSLVEYIQGVQPNSFS